MPDFRNMTIVEIENCLSQLLNSMPQKPYQVFSEDMSVLLADFSNRRN